MANIRTAEELLLPEYNYYIAFNILPTEKNATKIDTAIKQQKNGWTHGSPLQRRYMELYTDIENVMVNDLGYDATSGSYTRPGARAAELAAAKKIKLDAATKLVVSMCRNKSRLFKSEFEQLARNDTIKWFTAEELEKEVQYLFNQGITYIDNTKSRIRFSDYVKINDLLKTAKKKSLYELLECTPTASIAELAAANKKVYAVPRNKTSSEATAINALLGLASTVFRTEDSKRDYDNYLAVKGRVWDELDLRQRNGVKQISTEEYLSYAQIMRDTLKMDIDQVEQYLADGLNFFRLTLVGSSEAGGENPANLEICPYPDCGKAYSEAKGITSCPHCGKPLEIPCWNCGKSMPFTTKSKTCPTCGSTPQSKSLFDTRVAELDSVLRKSAASVQELQSALATLVNTVPKYKSYPDCVAAKKIADYERQIADRVKEEETTGVNYRNDTKKIEGLMSGKCYLQALNMAQNLKKTYGTYNTANTDKLIRDINTELTKAQDYVRKAKAFAAQSNEAMVVSHAARALEICADYSEARLLLQKYPPQAPGGVRLTVSDGAVRLDWEKGGYPDSMTTYAVIKKVGSKPNSPTDGTVVEKDLTITFYEDNHLLPATMYYYGVFAERCGIHSAVTATTANAIIYSDVSNVQQEVEEGKISVRWDTPHNVKDVEVWKKKGPEAPSSVGDGVKIPTNGKNGFVDNDCDGENSYLIVCAYEILGRTKYSGGIRRTMKKYEKLQKLQTPKVEQLGMGDFAMTFGAKPKQKVKLLCSKERLSCRLDTEMQMMSYSSVCRGCTTLPYSYDAQQNITFRLPEGQVCWVYPMVSNDQLFMLSKPFLLNNVTGIRNITYTEDNGTVLIKGVLQPEVRNIIVKMSSTDFPDTLETPGEKLIISKDRFASDGGVSLKLKVNSVNYISLFAELEKDGVKTVTKAVHVGDGPMDYRERVTVYHALKYKVSAKGTFQVTIEFSANAPVELPKLCVVKGHPRPLSKNAGELVDTIEPMVLRKGLFSKKYNGKATIVSGPCPTSTKFVVFPYDESVTYVQLKEVRNL